MAKAEVFCVNRDEESPYYLGRIEAEDAVLYAMLDHFPNLGLNWLDFPEDGLVAEDGNDVDA